MFQDIDDKKQLLDSKKPFGDQILNNLKQYYDVDFTYNSNALEGNTLSITETKLILEEGITIGQGKSLREHMEVVSHKEAIDYIEDMVSLNIDISEEVIKDLHGILFRSIDHKNAGVYRRNNVLISGSRHRPVEHSQVEEKMKELMSWYEEMKLKAHPIGLAALFQFKLIYIHPFGDGNGRTARLLMNLILLRNGYPMAIIRSEERNQYMKALEQACVNGDLQNFTELVARAVDQSLDTYLYMIN